MSRYADDHLLGFTGPKAEAEQIKQRLAKFLREELKLELSEEKTLITHARTGAARFLGYEITAQHDHSKATRGRRWTERVIELRVPRSVIKAKSARYLRRGKPAHRSDLVNQNDHTIVATFGAEYRGIVQYYLLAGNVYWMSRVRMGHADIDAEDFGGKAPLVGVEDGGPPQGQDRDTVRVANML